MKTAAATALARHPGDDAPPKTTTPPKHHDTRTASILNPLVSEDVRSLIALHDHGQLSAFEIRAPSHKALFSLSSYLRQTLGESRTRGLLPEILAQTAKFIKAVPAEHLYLRLEVTDKKPKNPTDKMVHICAYDTERAFGTDYLQIARRLTIFGTVSSVMTDTDLGTWLERGKKKCVVLSMGTQKNDDSLPLAPSLSPTLSLAVDLITLGLTPENETPRSLDEKAAKIQAQPELAALHDKIAGIKILATELQNVPTPNNALTLSTQIAALESKIAPFLNPEAPTTAQNLPPEILLPLTEILETILTENLLDTPQQNQSPAPALTSTSSTPLPLQDAAEIEHFKTAIAAILNDPQLLAPEKESQISDLLRNALSQMLADPTISPQIHSAFLSQLDDILHNGKNIFAARNLDPAPSPDTTDFEKISEIIVVLQDPEQSDAIKAALEHMPEGQRIFAALEQYTDTITYNSDIIARVPESLPKIIAEILQNTPDFFETAGIKIAAQKTEIAGLSTDKNRLKSDEISVVLQEILKNLAAPAIPENAVTGQGIFAAQNHKDETSAKDQAEQPEQQTEQQQETEKTPPGNLDNTDASPAAGKPSQTQDCPTQKPEQREALKPDAPHAATKPPAAPKHATKILDPEPISSAIAPAANSFTKDPTSSAKAPVFRTAQSQKNIADFLPAKTQPHHVPDNARKTPTPITRPARQETPETPKGTPKETANEAPKNAPERATKPPEPSSHNATHIAAPQASLNDTKITGKAPEVTATKTTESRAQKNNDPAPSPARPQSAPPIPPHTTTPPPAQNKQPPKPAAKLRPICPATGAEICLCRTFETAVTALKKNETLDLGNSITLQKSSNAPSGVAPYAPPSDAATVTVQDQGKDVVSGSWEEVKTYFKNNTKSIEDTLQKFFSTPSPPTSLPRQSSEFFEKQNAIKAFEIAAYRPSSAPQHTSSPSAPAIDDFDIDFGDDPAPM